MGGGVPTQSRGYRVTRICPLVVLSWYFTLQTQPSYHLPISPSASSISPTVITTACEIARFIPSCYHHCFETRVNGRCYASSNRSTIVRIAMYCTNVFWLSVMYVSTSSNPEPIIDPARGRGGGIPIRHLASSESTYPSAIGPTCVANPPTPCGSYKVSKLSMKHFDQIPMILCSNHIYLYSDFT